VLLPIAPCVHYVFCLSVLFSGRPCICTHSQHLRLRRAQRQALAGGPFNWEAAGKLPKMEASMRETLRLLPPSSLSFRELLRDVELEGYLLPKGWIVIAGGCSNRQMN
jgi:cytochrome P450